MQEIPKNIQGYFTETLLGLRLSDGPGRERYRAVLKLIQGGEANHAEIFRLLETVPAQIRTDARETIEEAAQHGVNVTSILDASYPSRLREIDSPPAILFSRGDLELVDSASVRVAIVGSRRSSIYGLRVAEELGLEISKRGGIVVSGLALGIDAAAHRGAIRGSTYPQSFGSGAAILGSGVDEIYPPENRDLSEQFLVNRGVIISEYGRIVAPRKYFFPERNRIVTGICELLIVVEAREKSGALISARLAAEQGREIYAVPGPLGYDFASGSNQLIGDGVRPLTDINQFLTRLFPQSKEKPKRAHGARRRQTPPFDHVNEEAIAQRVLGAVNATEQVHFESLLEICRTDPPTLKSILQQLEIFGDLTMLPGSFYTVSEFIAQ